MKQQQRNSVPTTPKRRHVMSFSAIATLLCAGALLSAEDVQDDIDAARSTIQQWVQTKSLISKERADWMLGKEMLVQRADLVEAEVQETQERIAEAGESLIDSQESYDKLSERRELLIRSSTTLRDSIEVLEQRVIDLLPRLPEPIQQRVRPLSLHLPKPGTEDQKEAALSQRYQNVVGILNAIDKFSQEITVVSERRAIGADRTVEVSVVYLGISIGYYVSADATIAGVGRSTSDGWQWTEANEAGEQIANAIAILQNEEPAAFVGLPVEIK